MIEWIWAAVEELTRSAVFISSNLILATSSDKWKIRIKLIKSNGTLSFPILNGDLIGKSERRPILQSDPARISFFYWSLFGEDLHFGRLNLSLEQSFGISSGMKPKWMKNSDEQVGEYFRLNSLPFFSSSFFGESDNFKPKSVLIGKRGVLNL